MQDFSLGGETKAYKKDDSTQTAISWCQIPTKNDLTTGHILEATTQLHTPCQFKPYASIFAIPPASMLFFYILSLYHHVLWLLQGEFFNHTTSL